MRDARIAWGWRAGARNHTLASATRKTYRFYVRDKLRRARMFLIARARALRARCGGDAETRVRTTANV